MAPCSTSVQTGAWTVISLFAACYGQAGTSTAGAVEASWRIQHGSRNTRSPWDKVGKLLGALEQNHRRRERVSGIKPTVTGLQESPLERLQ